MADYIFPKDFLWGTATSSYQIEGAVHEDGRGESIWDRFAHTPGKIVDSSNGDIACGHYHRWPEDIALLRELGVDSYRFSVAWPRVLPDGRGHVNEAGLDFYDRLVDGLLAAGIEPFLTLYHWDMPQALQDRGGWGNRDTAHAFAEYASIVANRLGDRVKHWMTHNEFWCVAYLGHYMGLHAPGATDLALTLQVSHHLMLSHGLAVPVLRQAVGEVAKIGAAPNYTPAYPASDNEADVRAAARFDGYFNRWYFQPLAGQGYPEDMWDFFGNRVPTVEEGDLDIIAAPLDFLGVNYYNRAVLADAPGRGAVGTRNIAEGELYYPVGLYDTLTRIHRDYGFRALYVTENGLAKDEEIVSDGEVDDSDRIAFLDGHFEQASRAIAEGVPLRGYFVWSLMDNFEWALGYTKRFGLVYVDYTTQQRIIKRSGRWFQKLTRAGH